ncbi:hypothetical protein L7F22_004516 [Adiantum nelumboides]|nr:hypothetical protein [Adiantum nelumboides]
MKMGHFIKDCPDLKPQTPPAEASTEKKDDFQNVAKTCVPKNNKGNKASSCRNRNSFSPLLEDVFDPLVCTNPVLYPQHDNAKSPNINSHEKATSIISDSSSDAESEGIPNTQLEETMVAEEDLFAAQLQAHDNMVKFKLLEETVQFSVYWSVFRFCILVRGLLLVQVQDRTVSGPGLVSCSGLSLDQIQQIWFTGAQVGVVLGQKARGGFNLKWDPQLLVEVNIKQELKYEIPIMDSTGKLLHSQNPPNSYFHCLKQGHLIKNCHELMTKDHTKELDKEATDPLDKPFKQMQQRNAYRPPKNARINPSKGTSSFALLEKVFDPFVYDSPDANAPKVPPYQEPASSSSPWNSQMEQNLILDKDGFMNEGSSSSDGEEDYASFEQEPNLEDENPPHQMIASC